ncbi:MAG: outer membrane beta-barrel protein [Chlorobiaceae bacterium]
MKKIAVLCAAITCLWAAPASADTYVSGSGGFGIIVNSNAIDYETGATFGAAVGAKSEKYRVEGAVNYQSNAVKSVSGIAVKRVHVSVVSVMLNGYMDLIIKDSDFTPYVMAGLGEAKIRSRDKHEETVDNNVFAWQVGTGVGIKTSENVTLDVGYRYLTPAKAMDRVGNKFSISDSNFLIGVRYGL